MAPNGEEPKASNQAPLFSVVIATYNYGHLIERAIDSVLNQTCQDFELIVVDDGSTDDTRERLERYGDRIRYLFQENSGQSTAYNRGADLASGRFIYILDADDELLPECLTRFAEAIRGCDHSTESSLFFAGYVSVAQDGTEKTRRPSDVPEEREKRFATFLRKQIKGVQNCTTAIPRSIFQHIRFPENLRRNTDIVFYGQALASFPAIKVDAIVAKIHEHPHRTRKKSEQVMQTGLAPVDALFDPAAIPEPLMRFRDVFMAQRLRSMARLAYLDGDFDEARKLYWRALATHPPTMKNFSSLRRMVLACIRRSRKR